MRANDLPDFDDDVDGVEVPDVFAVFADGAVGGEFAHARDVEDGGTGPPFNVAVFFGDLVLAFHVRFVVR